jgi:hypothetical protein
MPLMRVAWRLGLSNKGNHINTDSTEKQIKPQITRKENMALRARFSGILARSAVIYLLALAGSGDVSTKARRRFLTQMHANKRK